MQPTSDKDHKTRKETEINIDNFKNFHARRRWKHSMKVVALCNKLTRSRTLLKDSEDPEAPEADSLASIISHRSHSSEEE